MQRRTLASFCTAVAVLALAGMAHADAASIRAELGSALGTMSGNATRLRRALHDARARNDRDRIACASDGLSRADAALRAARERARAAEGALARGDEGTARVELSVVLSAREASRAATASVDACFAFGAPEPTEVTTVRWRAEPLPPPKR
jgi:hypothetical protein